MGDNKQQIHIPPHILSKAQEMGYEKELCYLVVIGYQGETLLRLLEGYKNFEWECSFHTSTVRHGFPTIAEWVTFKVKEGTLYDPQELGLEEFTFDTKEWNDERFLLGNYIKRKRLLDAFDTFMEKNDTFINDLAEEIGLESKKTTIQVERKVVFEIEIDSDDIDYATKRALENADEHTVVVALSSSQQEGVRLIDHYENLSEVVLVERNDQLGKDYSGEP